MPRWKLKDCPRCSGDLFLDAEEDGWLGHCLQCGFMGRYSNAIVSAQNPLAYTSMPVNKSQEVIKQLYSIKK
jgi:hypothetical protein